MSMRTKVLGMVDVLMRVPPLFVIDEMLKISMGLPKAVTEDQFNYNSTTASQAAASIIDQFDDLPLHTGDSLEFYKLLSLSTLKFLLCLLGNF